MRFLAYENVSNLVVEKLRAGGHEVSTVRTDLQGAPDPRVLASAQSTGSILITEDRDFGELVIRQKMRVLGVILLELDRLSNQAEADRVATVVAAQARRLTGHLTVIEPNRTRFRPL